MRFSTTRFGFVFYAALALAAGCADGEGPGDPTAPFGRDVGVDDSGVDAPSWDVGTEDSGAGDARWTDSGSEDAGWADTGIEDAVTEDAGVEDAGLEDAGVEDAGVEDAGVEDAGWEDAGGEDAGHDDTGDADTGVEDTSVEDTGVEDTGDGWDDSLSIQVRAFADREELDDGQGTAATTIMIRGRLGGELSGAAVSYSLSGLRYRTVPVEDDAFAFDIPVEIGENVLTVRAETRGGRGIELRRTYFGAIGSRAGTHDRQCQGPGTAERCQELCEELGGDYDASWGHIGGCRNMPLAVSGDDLDFTDPDAPDPVERATTHDQQCLGSTSDANREACQEICEGYGGTYDPDWGNIGGCRDMPGSGMSDLDFTDGTIYPAEPSRDATRDQQCLGPTSAANIARCEELCEEYGGTHDPDWGNIGGCRDMPASAGDLDFSDGTIRPEDPDR